jgi:hypothetical protein
MMTMSPRWQGVSVHSTYEFPVIFCIRPANLSITRKCGLLVQGRFDFVRGDVERDVHGALARAFRRSV